MKLNIVCFLLALLPVWLTAQEKLSKLLPPSSPASGILGLQPTTVLAPKSYQALETALFSNFNNNSGSIVPNDFALEFTPYWTQNHSLSVDEYLYPKSSIDQVIRNSSFSIASTQSFLLGDSTLSNALAFGYRTTFYFGNNKDREAVELFTSQLSMDQKVESKIVSEAEYLIENKKTANQKEFMAAIRNTIINAVYESGKYGRLKEAEEFAEDILAKSALIPPLDTAAPDPFLDSLYSLIGQKLSTEIVFNQFKTYVLERYGFSLDVAYAGVLNFPANKFESSYIVRQSFWVTPTYRFKDKLGFLKVMGVIRYEWYNTGYYNSYFNGVKTYENNLDYGLSVAGEFIKFSLSIELVGRKSHSELPAGNDAEGNALYRKEQNFDFQYIASFNYNLTDQVVLSYSLGNRFEPVLNPHNTLVSLLMLNIGFGSPAKKDIDWEQ